MGKDNKAIKLKFKNKVWGKKSKDWPTELSDGVFRSSIREVIKYHPFLHKVEESALVVDDAYNLLVLQMDIKKLKKRVAVIIKDNKFKIPISSLFGRQTIYRCIQTKIDEKPNPDLKRVYVAFLIDLYGKGTKTDKSNIPTIS
ncbi:MAG: hypothetical protein ACJAXH_003347 [Colwellia sp.]|jgi:hypothetical protein